MIRLYLKGDGALVSLPAAEAPPGTPATHGNVGPDPGLLVLALAMVLPDAAPAVVSSLANGVYLCVLDRYAEHGVVHVERDEHGEPLPNTSRARWWLASP